MNNENMLLNPENIISELLENKSKLEKSQSEFLKQQKYDETLREYEKLQGNWKELKEWVEGIGAKIAHFGDSNTFYISSKDMLKKMEELENK